MTEIERLKIHAREISYAICNEALQRTIDIDGPENTQTQRYEQLVATLTSYVSALIATNNDHANKIVSLQEQVKILNGKVLE